MADDYRADTNTTGRLTVGGSTKGVFETAYDADWFKVSLQAGTTYIFSLSGNPTGDGTLNNFAGISLNVQDSQGNYAPGQSYGTYQGINSAFAQFTAQSSGTFFFNLSGAYTVGSYTVRANTAATDDYSADIQTSATLRDGATLAGVFERADDVDWIKFHVEAGQIVVFSAGGEVSSSSFSGQIYDDSGNYRTGYSQYAPFIAQASGDYYYAVSAYGRIGAYTQTMQVITDDYDGDGTSTGRLSEGGQASGKIDYYGDADRFMMNMEAGKIYTITLKAQGNGTSPSLTLFGPGGTYTDIGSTSTAPDGTVTLSYQATSTGQYGVNVSGYDTRTYQLTAGIAELDDWGNTRDTAAALTLNQKVSGKLQAARDTDMFKLDLKGGVTYRFDLTADQSNYYLSSTLSDSGGRTVASMSGGSTHYSYTPTGDDTFYVAQSLSYSAAGSQGFTLTASLATDDYSANSATTGRLLVGGSRAGNIEDVNDRDWFALSLNANTYYWFNLDTAQQNGGTLYAYANTTFNLRDSSGAVVATVPQIYNGVPTMAFTTGAKGTYYLEVGSSSSSGTYTVRAQLGRADDYGNDQAHAAAVQANSIIKGEVEVLSDKDMFKLTAVAGMTYVVQLTPQKGSASVYGSAALDITGPDGLNVRGISSDNTVVRVFEATKSGDYYIGVSSSLYYGWTGTYTLVANAAGVDDFAASAGTTALLDPLTPVHGTIGVADDHDWIKVHLDAGRTYVFDLKGNLSGGGSLDTGSGYYSNAGMTLLDANGSYLANSALPSSTTGSDPRIRFQATTTGDFFLDVHGSGSLANTGTYTVQEVQTNLDNTGPKLLSSNAVDGATNLSMTPKFMLTFDETIMLSGGVSITDGYGAVVSTTITGPQASVAGNTLTVDPHTYLMPGMTYTVDLGSVVDLAGNVGSGAKTFTFTVAKPVTSGTDANDYLLGSGTSKTLDGGAGVDTAYYASSRAVFNIRHNADGSTTVQDYRGAGLGDTLTNIERLQFNDGAYALDIEGIAGQAYRLYQAAFNRTPDTAGLGFWIAHLDKGLSLSEAANFFINSPEFSATYGAAPADTDFVTLLYKNVLHRAPDTDGNKFWMDHLHDGLSRADALKFFSESPENHDAVAKLIGNGFGFTPYGG